MRFGVCAGPERANILADAGYDFIELSLASQVMTDESDEEFMRTTGKALLALPLPVETFNLFLRSGKIVGPDADLDYLRRYTASAFKRAAFLGGKVIVFGSGGARRIPDGFDSHRAHKQLREFLQIAAEIAESSGVMLAIEPLRQAESNQINLVSQGATLAREIASPGVQLLGDTFHMESEQEPLTALIEAKELLAHIHVADTKRLAPGTGTYDYVALFETLKLAAYDRRISIECTFGPDFTQEVTHALATLKVEPTVRATSAAFQG